MSNSDSDNILICCKSYHKNFFEFASLNLLTNNFVDVTLWVGAQFVNAHKIILASASQCFNNMLKNVSPERQSTSNASLFILRLNKTNIVQKVNLFFCCVCCCCFFSVFLKDVDYDDLLLLIEYIYSGQVVVSKARLDQFLNTAKLLKINGLSQYDSASVIGNASSDRITNNNTIEKTANPVEVSNIDSVESTSNDAIIQSSVNETVSKSKIIEKKHESVDDKLKSERSKVKVKYLPKKFNNSTPHLHGPMDVSETLKRSVEISLPLDVQNFRKRFKYDVKSSSSDSSPSPGTRYDKVTG